MGYLELHAARPEDARILRIANSSFKLHESACRRGVQLQCSRIDYLLNYRKPDRFYSSIPGLLPRAKDIVTIGVLFAIHDFKVFVEVFENDGRARDCLEPAHRRDEA